MNIDFTVSMQYWIDLIKEFIAVISDFLAGFNIKLFKASDAASADTTETTAAGE